MVSSFKAIGKYIAEYPLRGVLSILTIAFGVGVLVLAFTMTMGINFYLQNTISESDRVVMIANASVGDDGTIQRALPPQFTVEGISVLEQEFPELKGLTPVNQIRWPRIRYGQTFYQTRTVIGTGHQYAETVGLEIIAGSFFTEDDVNGNKKTAVLSRSAAEILFGSADAAVGKTFFTTDRRGMAALLNTEVGTANSGNPSFRDTIAPTESPFNVSGVFEDPPELRREGYGIGDIIIPFTSQFPEGAPVPRRILFNNLMAKTGGLNSAQVEARTKDILGRIQQDVEVLVWEGNPQAPNSFLKDARESAGKLSLTLNILGVILLFASSIGIFSIMMVEVLNRSREIGLRRAMGSTKNGIIGYFIKHAIYITLFGSIIGIALALIFNRPLFNALEPFIETAGLNTESVNIMKPFPLASAVSIGIAVIFGSVFGFFPAYSASRMSIIETLKEDG